MAAFLRTCYDGWKALRVNPERPRVNFLIDLFWDICLTAVLRVGVPAVFRFVDWLVRLSEGPGSTPVNHEFIINVATGLAIVFFLVSAANTVSKLLIVSGKSIVTLWKR